MDILGYIIAIAVLGSLIVVTFISTVCMCRKYKQLILRHHDNLKENNYNELDLNQRDIIPYHHHGEQSLKSSSTSGRNSGYIDVVHTTYETSSDAHQKIETESPYAEI